MYGKQYNLLGRGAQVEQQDGSAAGVALVQVFLFM